MSLAQLFQRVRSGVRPTEQVEGTIGDAPRRRQDGDSFPKMVVFHLEAHQDWAFRQELRPFVIEHRCFARAPVHFPRDGNGGRVVDWVEKL